MQDRYVGDIGDYAKYGLLRVLGAKRRLGVAWYLFPDEAHNADGKHTTYLHDHNAHKWRSYNPKLFDRLKNVVYGNRRNITAIEEAEILTQTTYSNKLLCAKHIPQLERKNWRKQWFEQVERDLRDCDIIFVDPDNGLCEDEKFKYGQKKYYKRIPLNEVLALTKGGERPVIVYHHNGRSKKHEEEIKCWQQRLGEGTLALRWRAGSARTFFVVNPSADMPEELADFADRWGKKAEFVPAI